MRPEENPRPAERGDGGVTVTQRRIVATIASAAVIVSLAGAIFWMTFVREQNGPEDACVGQRPGECSSSAQAADDGRNSAVMTEFDPSMCPGEWLSTTNELQGGPGGSTTELGAIVAEIEATLYVSVPEHALRVVTNPLDDGFLVSDRSPDSATFVLVVGGSPRGSVTVERFGEHSFGALGATWCIS
jgi:hypothetical protein